MKRRISPSTPATTRSNSPRILFDDTWTVMSDGRGFATSTISSSGSAARAVALSPMSDSIAVMAVDREALLVDSQIDE